MKKLFGILIVAPLFMGCNFEKEEINLNKGLKIEEINKMKKRELNFNKKNIYPNNSITKESVANTKDLHKGCTAPCCSEGGE